MGRLFLILLLALPLAPQWRRVEPQPPAALPQQQPAPPPAQLPAPARDPHPESGPVFRAETAWVRLDVQVGRKNALISDLSQDDFLVFDEDQPQPVGHFARDTGQLDLVLLLDGSGSMRRFLKQVASTASLALQQLHPGDRAAVMAFGRRTELLAGFSADLKHVQNILEGTEEPRELGAGTQINPAVLSASEYIRRHAGQGRRAILILTDNQALHYQSPDEEAIRALLQADTVFNGLVLRGAERPKPPRSGEYVNPDFTPADVWKLAEASGGEVLEGGDAFRTMIERIRTRYTLMYHAPPAAAGEFRRVRVELSPAARTRHPGAWVRARSGYFVK